MDRIIQSLDRVFFLRNRNIPPRAEIVFYLGVAYSESGDQQSSLSPFEKARDLDSSYHQACLYREGIAYSRLNLRARAMVKVEEAKRIDPESAYGRSAQDYLRLLKPKRFDLYATTGMEWDSNVILKPEKARSALTMISPRSPTGISPSSWPPNIARS